VSPPSVRPPISELLRVPPGAFSLAERDPGVTVGFTGEKEAAQAELAELAPQLASQQDLLYAEGYVGVQRALLLVLQGMDTSGKSGTIKAVLGPMNPQGTVVASFKKPTPEELAQHFLWRIRKVLPPAGRVGVFDRSHYEDVLIARVRELVPREVVEGRYEEINAFEAELTAAGIRVVKVFLHISEAEQRRRLLARLDDPTKHWKFDPADVDERSCWDEYQRAYEIAISRCTSADAPWYVVAADRKWYRNWAVSRLVLEQLQALGLDWPPADFDVDEQRRRLLAGA
jgi:PPK2 family polyphosphate:nucleotide phosphotransferase